MSWRAAAVIALAASAGCTQVLGLDGLHDRVDGGALAVGLDATHPSDVAAHDARTADREAVDAGARDATGALDARRVDSAHGDDASDARLARDARMDAGRDSGPTEPPSCATAGPGRTNCGAVPGESCCASLPVEAGAFYESFTAGEMGGSQKAEVAALRIDKYLVTVGRFAEFVSAADAGYHPPEGSGRHAYLNSDAGLVSIPDSGAGPTTYEQGWSSTDNASVAPTDTNLTTDCGNYSSWPNPGSIVTPDPRLPINCVNWYEAYAFCIWDGGFLPTLAEWEYVTVGPAPSTTYPWGNTAPGTSNEYAIFNCNYPQPGAACTDYANISPVGTASRGAGKWGQLDLVGELDEWLLDGSQEYGVVNSVVSCNDCVYQGSFRMVRGTDYESDLNPATVQHLSAATPDTRSSFTGFRCARAL
jgi:formylglycine-generating enzyme required for sulfatase activity